MTTAAINNSMNTCYGFDRDTSEGCERTATERTPAGQHLCQRHADEFWATRQKIDRDYPDSDLPPAWFDPTYAGESWN